MRLSVNSSLCETFRDITFMFSGKRMSMEEINLKQINSYHYTLCIKSYIHNGNDSIIELCLVKV